MTKFSTIAAGVLMLAAFTGGCSSSNKGVERSAKTADGIAVVQKEMAKGIAQIDATTAALNDLATAPKADLTGQYKTYTKQVDELEAMAKRIASRNQSMKARAKEYFEAWEKESAGIKSDTIRSISAERRAAARASFDKMAVEIANGKAAFTPLMEELNDIELYLSNDLTAAGVAACKPIADEANANAAKVKTSLNNVMAELGRVQSELSPNTGK